MILVVNNSKDLYKATMTPKLLDVLVSLDVSYIIINKKKDFKKVENLCINGKIKGIILTGGPLCITDNIYYNDIIKNITALHLFPDVPVLGICFGFQVINDIYGGTIGKLPSHNLGFKNVNLFDSCISLFSNLKDVNKLFFSHNDEIKTVPYNFNFFTSNNIIIAIEHKEKDIFGVQFHPEGSLDGHNIIKNFIFNFCY